MFSDGTGSFINKGSWESVRTIAPHVSGTIARTFAASERPPTRYPRPFPRRGQSPGAELGEKPYRAKQLWEWLWKKKARSWEDMSDLPKAFRDRSWRSASVLQPLVLAEEQRSEDGTVKCAFRTWDGHVVEGVLIPTPTRLTACISSQIGCSLTCSFCATGKLKRIRNLDAGEIVDQVVLDRCHRTEVLQDRASRNIVYMGMGEPLLNYANTMRSAERITAQDGLAHGRPSPHGEHGRHRQDDPQAGR